MLGFTWMFPDKKQRQRKSVPIGPCTGKDKLTKPEAVRKGAEVVASLGVNTPITSNEQESQSGRHVQAACRMVPQVSQGLDGWETKFRAEHGKPTH